MTAAGAWATFSLAFLLLFLLLFLDKVLDQINCGSPPSFPSLFETPDTSSSFLLLFLLLFFVCLLFLDQINRGVNCSPPSFPSLFKTPDTRQAMDFFLGFQESKLKSHLKMAVHRIAIQVNKKTSAQKHAKREIATLLADMKDEKARIKVEHVIREDFTIEALGLLELLCELTHERSKYIASEKTCPADLKEAIVSLIWATNRVDIAELDEVKKQFTLKYGKEFSEEANNNAANTVNVRLFQKLSVTPPSAFLVIRYLEEIAREYEVEWVSTDLGLPRPVTQQQPQPQAQGGGNDDTTNSTGFFGRTSTISHDGRVIGSSSSKVAPLPAGGYPGSSSSGAGADMYLPMSSPGRL